MNILNRLLIINIFIISITAEDIDTITAKLKIKIYNGSSIELAEIVNVPIDQPDIIYQNVNNSKSSVLYIHGFSEKPSDESVRTIVDAYLNRGTDNMFILDWSKLSSEEYFSLIPKVRVMGKITAKTFDRLFKLGLNLDTFHVIGHSMGAPLAGAIETDGTVDFFANGGKRPQPGCPNLESVQDLTGLCSHRKSWRIYAQSIKNPQAFVALQCPSYSDYLDGNCNDNNAVYFGLSTPTDALVFYSILS
ncbi:hypothetical protein G9C98_001457 [Cotesia typhae]|uniref:phospholipase A1 n=1 Tax=Cotesia typhae TaxID=2053667 RepID=A0A8J5QQK2_9HYME|nr:hypothetical protein G9C98_001457 [Cotesia typhae]